MLLQQFVWCCCNNMFIVFQLLHPNVAAANRGQAVGDELTTAEVLEAGEVGAGGFRAHEGGADPLRSERRKSGPNFCILLHAGGREHDSVWDGTKGDVRALSAEN
jgi:hypothetical protein